MVVDNGDDRPTHAKIAQYARKYVNTPKRIGCVLALFLIAIIAFYSAALLPLSRRNEPQAIWHKDSTTPLYGNRFYVVVFPDLNNGSTAAAINQLDINRAVLVSLDEMSEDSIDVCVNASTVESMPADFLTAAPPTNNTTELIDELNNAITHWGNESDWSSVEFACRQEGNVSSISLTVHSKHGERLESRYTVDGAGEIAPESLFFYP